MILMYDIWYDYLIFFAWIMDSISDTVIKPVPLMRKARAWGNLRGLLFYGSPVLFCRFRGLCWKKTLMFWGTFQAIGYFFSEIKKIAAPVPGTAFLPAIGFNLSQGCMVGRTAH